jgi:protein-tyrosine phosphatase
MSSAPDPSLPPPRDPAGPYRVCIVCLGNICRSPMAEVALRAELERAGLDGAVAVDSAGTGDWHVGERMDSRASAELLRRGYDGSAHRSRQFTPPEFAQRDLVLAMDRHNLADLRRMAPDRETARDRIRLFARDREVPDPYGLGAEAFSDVLDLVEDAAAVLTAELSKLCAGRDPRVPDS